jgi:hypothetical protein
MRTVFVKAGLRWDNDNDIEMAELITEIIETTRAIPPTPVVVLRCDMSKDCTAPITHIDRKGYLYCTKHGHERHSAQPCRKMTADELAAVRSGEALVRYY